MLCLKLNICFRYGSWWWRGTGALGPGGGVALVHWILVVAWHWCTGSWWWRGTGALGPGGGVHWILVGAWGTWIREIQVKLLTFLLWASVPFVHGLIMHPKLY